MLTDKDFMQQNDIEKLKQSALQGLGSADNEEDLEQWRIRFLGRKGEISTLMRGLSSVSETDRAVLGSSANELKLYLCHLILNHKIVLVVYMRIFFGICEQYL